MMLFLARYSVVGILVSITVLITVYLGVSRSIYFKHSDKGVICFIPVLQLGVLFELFQLSCKQLPSLCTDIPILINDYSRR